DGETGGGVFARGDVVVVAAGEAVFGAEQGDELDARGARDLVDGAAAQGVLAGVIGDEADMLAAERGEFFGFEDVDAELDAAGAGGVFCGGALRGTPSCARS